MPLADSEAIILRNYPLGEGDLLVSFLSRMHGRLRGVARGARRPKSRFGSTLEPLSVVRIWFFERENRELVRITQCELQESFLAVQKDYEAGVGLALLSEICEAILPEREASDSWFRLLVLCSRGIKSGKTTRVPVAYLALWALRLGGWLPDLFRCVGCGRPFQEEAVAGGGGRSGLFCKDCRLPGMTTLRFGARRLAQKMLDQRLDKLELGGGELADVGGLCSFLLNLVEQHSEKKLIARRLFVDSGQQSGPGESVE